MLQIRILLSDRIRKNSYPDQTLRHNMEFQKMKKKSVGQCCGSGSYCIRIQELCGSGSTHANIR